MGRMEFMVSACPMGLMANIRRVFDTARVKSRDGESADRLRE